MRCPACRAELVVVERERTELDWCPFCRGFWFDGDELEALAQTLGVVFSPLQGTQRPGRRACPRCDTAMNVVTLEACSQLEVDLCPEGHGLWLDAGELASLSGLANSRTPGELVTFFGEKLRRKP